MSNDRFRDLLHKALTRTRERALPWEETFNEDAFQVLFEHGALLISRNEEYTEDDQAVDTIRVTVLNRDGRIVKVHSVTPADADYELMKELYQHVLSQARQSDQVINELIAELG